MLETKFYWLHDESDCVGVCDTKEQLHELIDSDPLVAEIEEKQYLHLIQMGFDH